ncbi:MAG: L,D-transpeptidase [Bdellovibrionaceae bacterium]|nr:L,D-transpeptidase [Pseudobdellovibrionaceae bacterium]
MKKFFVTCLIALSSSVAFGFESTFLDESALPTTINSVHMEVFDMARTELGCTYEICFRMEVYVNDVLVARWATSPGDPYNDQPGFNGVNTPKYNNRSLNRSRIMGPGYISGKGDSMPYSMFILGSQGQNTGFAVHAGVVTGLKESHGCVRLEYANAQKLNSWVKQAIKNKGPTTISTQHTTD